MSKSSRPPCIVIGVTVDVSIPLLGDIPYRLSECGWDVHIVSSGGPNTYELGLRPGITVHSLTMRREPAPLHDVVGLVRWVLLLLKLRPRVVWVGTPKAALLSMVAGVLTCVPVRSYLVRGLRMETSSRWRRLLLRWIESVTIRCSTDVVAISASLKSRLEELGLVREKCVSVLGRGSSHGVDLDRFDPSKHSAAEARGRLGVGPDEFVIGFVGRICEDKGVRELSEAVMAISASDRALLVLVGSVEDPALLREIQESCDGRVRHIEHTEAIETLYPAFTVLCLPSHREGFGNVVIEAAAMGVPAVVTDATGVRDSVDSPHTGLIVAVGDLPALTWALELFLESGFRGSLGLAAQSMVREHFAAAWVEQQYVDHLERIAGDGPEVVVASIEGRITRGPNGQWMCRAPHAHWNYWESVLVEGCGVTLVAREVEGPLENATAISDDIGVHPIRDFGPDLASVRALPGTLWDLMVLLRGSSSVYLRMPGVVGPLITFAALLARKRLVVHLVGNPAEVARVFSSKWKAGLAHGFVHCTTAFAARRAEVVLYVDPALAETFTPPRLRGYRPPLTFQKRNVDLRSLSWSERPRTLFGDPLVLVAAGSQERNYKGHDLLISACADLVDRGFELRLRLIGDGRLRPSLQRLAEERGVLERVEFLGHLPGTAVVQAEIAACDLFLQPSRTEGFPRALVEAMATGVPCLATDVGAVAGILPPELLIASPNVDAIRNAIEFMAADVDRLAAAASACLAAAWVFRDEQEAENTRFARVLTRASGGG